MTTIRSNLVKIRYHDQAINSIKFIEGSFIITRGQAWDPPIKIHRDSNYNYPSFDITAEAGREKSTDVANQFKTMCGKYKRLCHDGTFVDSAPDELNFFFQLAVEFSSVLGLTTVDLYLGQGSNLHSNNWWIGGNNIVNFSGIKCLLIAKNSSVFAFPLSAQDDSFTFGKGTLILESSL